MVVVLVVDDVVVLDVVVDVVVCVVVVVPAHPVCTVWHVAMPAVPGASAHPHPP